MMQRLYDRIDVEVKDALHPFGYYEPTVAAEYQASGKDWQVAVAIIPGEPMRIRELNVEITGPGADDAVFDRHQAARTCCASGMRLRSRRLPGREGRDGTHRDDQRLRGREIRRSPGSARIPRATPPASSLVLDTGPRYSFGKIDIEAGRHPPGTDAALPALPRRPALHRRRRAVHAASRWKTACISPTWTWSVDETEADPETLTVPVRITASKGSLDVFHRWRLRHRHPDARHAGLDRHAASTTAAIASAAEVKASASTAPDHLALRRPHRRPGAGAHVAGIREQLRGKGRRRYQYQPRCGPSVTRRIRPLADGGFGGRDAHHRPVESGAPHPPANCWCPA